MTVNLAHLDEPRVAKCKIAECPNGGKLHRGWCAKHYRRWYVHGDPMGGRENYATPEEALSARTEWREGCLEWTGAIGPDGYGVISVRGKVRRAHRFSYESSVAPIPEGMQIDHICRNRACINPEHLRPVTHKQNHEHLSALTSTSVSGFRGVTWSKSKSKWEVQATHNGRKHFGGRFLDLEDARRAAADLRNSLFTHNDEDRAREKS